MSSFACRACGSPAIEVPRDMRDESWVHCSSCGEALSRWGAFKRAAAGILLGESALTLSADPLPDVEAVA